MKGERVYEKIGVGELNYGWDDLAGNVGVALIVVAYLLLQLGRLRGTGLSYSALNALGALLVIISLLYDFNLSAFVMEAFWVLISLIGIIKHFTSKSPAVVME